MRCLASVSRRSFQLFNVRRNFEKVASSNVVQRCKVIFEKLNYAWSNNLHHLSYGMVDLPSDKMKSREGTVVDADEIIDEINAIHENNPSPAP